MLFWGITIYEMLYTTITQFQTYIQFFICSYLFHECLFKAVHHVLVHVPSFIDPLDKILSSLFNLIYSWICGRQHASFNSAVVRWTPCWGFRNTDPWILTVWDMDNALLINKQTIRQYWKVVFYWLTSAVRGSHQGIQVIMFHLLRYTHHQTPALSRFTLAYYIKYLESGLYIWYTFADVWWMGLGVDCNAVDTEFPKNCWAMA